METKLVSSSKSQERPVGSVYMDGVRGAAALLVVVGHTTNVFFQPTISRQQTQADTSVPDTSALFHKSLAGQAVMIFFVLSGYLVGGSVIRALRSRRWSWTEYLVHRLARLWTVLLPALLLVCVLDWTGATLFHSDASLYWHPAGHHFFFAPVLDQVSTRIFFANAFFLQTIAAPSLGSDGALWSLANEWWYYLLFPLVALAVWPGVRWPTRAICLLCAAAIALLVGVRILVLFPIWLLGAITYVIPPVLPPRLARAVAILLAVLTLPLMVVLRRMDISQQLADWPIAIFFSLQLYLWAHWKQPAKAGLLARLAGESSRLSYPLYLTHDPVLAILCAWYVTPYHLLQKTPKNLLVAFAVVFVTVGVAYLFDRAFQSRTEQIRQATLRLVERLQTSRPKQAVS